MPNFDVTKTKIYIAAVAFAAIIPTVTYFGVPIPKVAWAYEVEDLEEDQLEAIVDLYSRELREQRRERLTLKREQQRILKEGEQLSDADLLEQEYLELDIEEIQETIEDAKEQLLQLK